MMTDNGSISMIVHWKKQSRSIDIKTTDNISAIEKVIVEAFELNQNTSLSKYQIQFYDSNYQTYMDLYPKILPSFQAILCKLLSQDAPARSDKAWSLRIVSKIDQAIDQSFHGSITDDTYTYQQVNDSTQIPANEELSLSICNSTNDLPSVRSLSETISSIPHNLSRNREENTSEHPYRFRFQSHLGDDQRKQYESEMIRTDSSNNKTSLAGVLLCTKTNSHPILLFHIPAEEINLAWSIDIYILTEADDNGTHYLHASKGIFRHDPKSSEDASCSQTGKIVNPHNIKLNSNDLRDGKYE
ncbi:hypothetical protein I4U23_029132 [Adineta vaga]|nr:hypothetical protein I4U23_029132 [Adineta vaga]